MVSEEEEKAKIEAAKLISNDFDIELRPSADSGWWLCSLLPIVFLVNYWKHKRALTFEYKYSTIVAFGLLLQTVACYIQLNVIKSSRGRFAINLIAPIVESVFVFVCLHQGIVFSALTGFASTITYNGLYFYILRRLPKSFSHGEAAIIVQGFVVFLLNVFIKLATIWDYEPVNESDKMSTILQIGLFGVTFIVGCCNFLKIFRGMAFYALLVAVLSIIILFPIGDALAIIVLFEFLFKDLQKLCIVTLYLGLIGLTIVTVNWQINRGQRSNTRTRKIFHVLIVLVFVPGLIYQCTLLFVATGIALALLVGLETMRIIQLPPFHSILEQSVKSFIDEQDAGYVALTPIYLLIGCSMPMWLHPCPCDLTDAAVFELLPLLAGVISVGLGDTAASVVGSKFGRIKWSNSKKTLEGTIAGICLQALIFPVLVYGRFIHYSNLLALKFAVAIVGNSLIETFTDQVDNLVLPLVTFILLSI